MYLESLKGLNIDSTFPLIINLFLSPLSKMAQFSLKPHVYSLHTSRFVWFYWIENSERMTWMWISGKMRPGSRGTATVTDSWVWQARCLRQGSIVTPMYFYKMHCVSLYRVLNTRSKCFYCSIVFSKCFFLNLRLFFVHLNMYSFCLFTLLSKECSFWDFDFDQDI